MTPETRIADHLTFLYGAERVPALLEQLRVTLAQFRQRNPQLPAARECLNLLAHLQNNDAYPPPRVTNDLLVTGLTNTNVNDLIFVFVEAPVTITGHHKHG